MWESSASRRASVCLRGNYKTERNDSLRSSVVPSPRQFKICSLSFLHLLPSLATFLFHSVRLTGLEVNLESPAGDNFHHEADADEGLDLLKPEMRVELAVGTKREN
jgi:hypothetical protein